MNVTFYATATDRRKLDKSLVQIHADSGVVLKDDNSLTNVYLDVHAFSNWEQVNYIYVDAFRRYYYAKPEPLKGGMIRFKCHTDVLMSNKDEILNLSAIINRSTSVPNDYLVDSEQGLLNYKTQRILNFPTSMSFSTSLTYILAVAGGGAN